jgi:hypothetical protein
VSGWTLRRRYRRALIGYWGEVYACPPFVDHFLDGVPMRKVDSRWALTETAIRRKLARILWRRSHPKAWAVRGRGLSS